MPRHRPRIEYVTVTPDGFRYRGRVHDSVNALLKWFKEHFRDPIPGVPGKYTSSHCIIVEMHLVYSAFILDPQQS